MSLRKHEELIKLYFDEMNREELHQHNPTSMDQVRAADKEVFLRLADQTRRGFSALGDLFKDPPVLPLDDLLERTMNHPRVVGLLLLLKRPVPQRNTAQNDKKRDGGEVERLREQVKKQKQSPANASKGSGGKGGGKG